MILAADSEFFIHVGPYIDCQPVGDVGDSKSMYKEVVLGGDVWDLLDELMIYMGNPMQFYERGVQFVRVKI